MATQVSKIRTHLDAGKTITPATASAVYGIWRLASVIEDLRRTNMEIDTVMKIDEEGKQYAEYRARRTIALDSHVQVRAGYGIGAPKWIRKMRAARVIAKQFDASLVRFIRGTRLEDFWLNDKELVRAD